MSPSQVQQKTAVTSVAASSLAATFTSAPTQSNLLLAAVCSDATVSTPSGWSVAKAQVDEVGLYLFYKVAGASESATVTVNPTSSASTELWIAEYAGLLTTGVFDVAAGANSADSTLTASSGTTATTAQASELAVAAFGYNNNPATFPTADSYSNGFTEQAELTGLGGTSTRLAVATSVLTTTTAATTTVTFSGAQASHKAGLIATFKAAAGGTDVNVTSPAAAATAGASPPSMSVAVDETAGVATAAAAGPSLGIAIAETAGTVTASAPNPTVATGGSPVTIAVPAAGATAGTTTHVPADTVTAVAAGATAGAVAAVAVVQGSAAAANVTAGGAGATLQTTVGPTPGSATAGATAPTLSVAAPGAIATATASAAAPGSTVQVVAPAAAAFAYAAPPTNFASADLPVQVGDGAPVIQPDVPTHGRR